MLTNEIISNIENDFNTYIDLFPFKKEEILNILKNLSKDLRVFFMKAITQMSATDIISVDILDVLQHVIHTYKTITTINYCVDLPIDIIFNYILPYRVNDEDFSLYSTYFYKELQTLINPDNIQESALMTNYWCFSNATYAQADDRTQNALTTIKSGYGRCGEESVLLVSALRSIGIPARQCYSPFWSHCDDNHAWVEIFTGSKWEFLGACEPEEKLNLGWFNNAASRALLVRHRVFGLDKRYVNNDQNNIFTTIGSTDIYIKTKKVTISVTNQGVCIPYAKVGLYTINYCMPKLILEKTSDCNGKVEFEIGRGDSIFFTYYEGMYDMKVCLEDTSHITLDISRCVKSVDFNLSPYEGHIQSADLKYSKLHTDKLSSLKIQRKSSHSYTSNSNDKYIKQARLNSDVIEKFINNTSILEEHKIEILETLTKKDFCDIKYDALCDMEFAFKYKGKHSDDCFNKYLLPLRVENEPLYPYKQFIMEYFADKQVKTPEDILEFLNEMTIVDKFTYNGLVADIKGVMQNKMLTTFSLPIHLVQIARALGIPARLNPHTKKPEYFDGKSFIYFYSANTKKIDISINKATENNLYYGIDYTICKIDNGYFNYMSYPEGLNLPTRITVDEGLYAITQATRQIDGSITASIYFDNSAILQEPIDYTKKKFKNIDIPDDIYNLNGKVILAYIQNNSEPTEHFLNELLENEDRIKSLNINILLFGNTDEKNQTLLSVLDKDLAKYNISQFNSSWSNLRKNMHIGDLRLPFITTVKDKKALYSFANYNVGTVDLVIKILC